MQSPQFTLGSRLVLFSMIFIHVFLFLRLFFHFFKSHLCFIFYITIYLTFLSLSPLICKVEATPASFRALQQEVSEIEPLAWHLI